MVFIPKPDQYIPIDRRRPRTLQRNPKSPGLPTGIGSKRQDQIDDVPDDVVPTDLTIPEDAPPDAFLAVPIFRPSAPSLNFYKGTNKVGQFTELPVPTKEETPFPNPKLIQSITKTLQRELSTKICRARLTLCLMYFYKVFLWCRIYYHSDGTPRQYGKDWSMHLSRRFMIRPVRVLSGLVEIYRMVNTNTTPITRETQYTIGTDVDPNDNSIETLCQLVMKRTSMDPGRNNACLGNITAKRMAEIIKKILDLKHQFGNNEEEDMLEIKKILEVTVKNQVQRKKSATSPSISNPLKQIMAGQSPSPDQNRFMEGYYSEPSFPLRKIIQEFTISWNIGTKYQDANPDIKKYLMGKAKYSDTVKTQLQKKRAPYDFYSEPGVEGDDAILQKSIVQGKDIDPPLDRNSILTIDQPTTEAENTPEFKQKLTNILMNLFQLYGQYCFINFHRTINEEGVEIITCIKQSIPYEFYESELTIEIEKKLRNHMDSLDLLKPTEDIDKGARLANALRVRTQNAPYIAQTNLFDALPPDLVYQTKADGDNKMGQYDMNDPADFYCFFCEIIIPFLYLKIWDITRQILAMTERKIQAFQQIQQKLEGAIQTEMREEMEPRWGDIDKLTTNRSIDQSENERRKRIIINKITAMNISLEAAKFEAAGKDNKKNRIKQMALTWYFLLSQFQLEYLNSVHTSPLYKSGGFYPDRDIKFQNPLFKECDLDNVLGILSLSSLSTEQMQNFVEHLSFFEGKKIYHGFTYLKNPSGLPPPPPKYLLSNTDQTSYFDDMVRYMIRRARHLSPKNQRFMLKYCCQYDSELLNHLLPKQLKLDYFNAFYDSNEPDELRRNLIRGIIGVEANVREMNFIREKWSRR